MLCLSGFELYSRWVPLNLAPDFVCELLYQYTPGRSLRSSSLDLLLPTNSTV